MPAITVAMRTEISQLYVSLFGRAPDGEGLGFWVSSYSNGNSIAKIAQSMYDTAPARAYYPLFATPSEVVTTFYTNVLGRAPDAEGLAFWVKEYNASATQGAFFEKLINNVVNYNGTDAAGLTSKSLFANKVSVAQYYGELNGTVAGAAAALSGVTSVAASVDTAKAAISSTSATGQAFTLTTGTDTLTGTSGNDIFAGNDTTFALADAISGGTGTDRFNFLDTSNAGGILGTSITGVEQFYIRNVETANAGETYDFSIVAGETEVWSDRSTDAVTFSALAAGTVVGLNGDGATVLGGVTFEMAAATDAVSIAINGGVGASGTAPGITESGSDGTATTATITSTGAANTVGTVDLANASLTSATVIATTNLKGDFFSQTTNEVGTGGVITISGAATSVEFTAALDNTIATIDASGLAGGLTATLGSLVTQKVTGGKGNDVITTAATLTTGTVAAGEGSDTLVAGTMANINTTALGAKYTGFETLRLIHATANTLAMDSTLSGITAIELQGDATLTQLTATQAANIKIRSNQTDGTADDMSFALFDASGKSDVLSIIAGTGTTTTSASDIAALIVTGFETLNVQALAGPTSTAGAGGAKDRTTNITGTIDGANLTTINLTGTAVNIANIAIANATAATTINGSALTGDGASTSVGLTVAGNAIKGSTITGSGVRDVFTIGAEGATYNSGGGNDLFITTTTLATADGTNDLTMAAGDGTTDTLQLTTFSNVTDAAFTNHTGFEALVLDAVITATTVVSATLGSAARTAFADGVTVTSGTTANGAKYTFNSGLYNKNVKITAAVSSDGATTDDDTAIATGVGNDTISLTASSWVGATGAGHGYLTVTSGAGDDNITVSVGTLVAITTTTSVSITGGAGKDTISLTSVNAGSGLTPTFVVAAGDSTVSAYDSITGFDMATANLFASTLDFDSFSIGTYAATAASGYSAGELTVAVAATTGLVTFSGTAAASATLAQKIAAVQSVVTTTAGHTALFTHGSNSYVFNNNATADSLVELVGISATAILSGGNAKTDLGIFVI
jgi:hypothetical protein